MKQDFRNEEDFGLFYIFFSIKLMNSKSDCHLFVVLILNLANIVNSVNEIKNDECY